MLKACAHHPEHDCENCEYSDDKFWCFNDQLMEDFDKSMELLKGIVHCRECRYAKELNEQYLGCSCLVDGIDSDFVMIEHWERSAVIGYSEDGERACETVLHRRGADALQMAMRRNPELAACSRVEIRTAEAFQEDRQAEDARRPEDIPRGRNNSEEWEW